MGAWSTPKRRSHWMAAATLIVVVAGCGASDPAQRAATAPAERLDLSVVAVTARIGGDVEQSSGVVVDTERGLILTTAHGIWGARSLKVSTGIAVLHGRIVARDACDDLAVLETQPRLPGLVAVRPSADAALPPGAPAVAVQRRAGLPSRERAELTTQRIDIREGGTSALLPGVRPADSRAIDGALPASASGAPLLGGDGRLAGLAQVVERGRSTTRAALPWDTIAARLGELTPGGRAEYVGWRRHYRCAEALHRHAAAQHPGYRRAHARLTSSLPISRLPGTEEVDR
jgi:S1-C subfamily serine protease